METVISVKNVSMMFNLNRDKVVSFKEYIVKAIKRELHYDEFWALMDVSFEVNRGDVVGIVGLNGSGKSTLLKIISGVFKPTHGIVKVYGEVSPLLELGAGFDPEFSARENVYMNGAMHGHSPSHMASLYKSIMDFAELWDFEDVPIKNFSSGMSARLGFSVAVQIKPDILIVDEVLGVGDYLFGLKCKAKIQEILQGGATVLLVSHDMGTIEELCNRAILIQKGRLIADSTVDEIRILYQPDGGLV